MDGRCSASRKVSIRMLSQSAVSKNEVTQQPADLVYPSFGGSPATTDCLQLGFVGQPAYVDFVSGEWSDSIEDTKPPLALVCIAMN